MPRCQGGVIFAISLHQLALTILFLAYQMPYGRILRKPDARHSECEVCDRLRRIEGVPGSGLVMILGRAGAIEMKSDFTEEANVEF
jgi:hypothetical protein